MVTKKYAADLKKALRCAEVGGAYHWPTIAEILAAEVKRLTAEQKQDADATASMVIELRSVKDELTKMRETA